MLEEGEEMIRMRSLMRSMIMSFFLLAGIPSMFACWPPASVGLRPIAWIMSRPEYGFAPAYLLPLLHILPLHDVW